MSTVKVRGRKTFSFNLLSTDLKETVRFFRSVKGTRQQVFQIRIYKA